jgi:hypothetical protein
VFIIVYSGLHEDLERLERIIVKDYKQEAKGHKEKLQQNHRVRKRMDEMQQIARKLVRCGSYADWSAVMQQLVDAA